MKNRNLALMMSLALGIFLYMGCDTTTGGGPVTGGAERVSLTVELNGFDPHENEKIYAILMQDSGENLLKTANILRSTHNVMTGTATVSNGNASLKFPNLLANTQYILYYVGAIGGSGPNCMVGETNKWHYWTLRINSSSPNPAGYPHILKFDDEACRRVADNANKFSNGDGGGTTGGDTTGGTTGGDTGGDTTGGTTGGDTGGSTNCGKPGYAAC